MKSAGAFVIITFALSWTLWFGAAAIPQFASNPLFYLPGTIAPAIVALGLTLRCGGRPALDVVLGRLFAWRVNWRWYVFAVTFMAAAKLTAAVAHRGIIGEWPNFGVTPVGLTLAAILVSTPVQAGEEIGWRGFMLPALSTQMGFAPASLLVGVFWAVWHLPMFFIAGSDMVGQSFWVFLLSVVALSAAMTWLFANTGGSLLLVMLMHAAVNNTTGIVPAAVLGSTRDVLGLNATHMGWLTVAVLWAFGFVFLLCMHNESVTRRPGGGVQGQL